MSVLKLEEWRPSVRNRGRGISRSARKRGDEGSGDSESEETTRRRQQASTAGITRGLVVVDHLHLCAPYLYCLPRWSCASAVVCIRTRVGML
jgi:hypothetical protein